MISASFHEKMWENEKKEIKKETQRKKGKHIHSIPIIMICFKMYDTIHSTHYLQIYVIVSIPN